MQYLKLTKTFALNTCRGNAKRCHFTWVAIHWIPLTATLAVYNLKQASNMETNQELLTFLAANPKSTKEAIKTATSLGGLHLYGVMKKLIAQQKLTEHTDEDVITYSIGPVEHEGEAPELIKAPVKPKSTGRDNSTYKFQGHEYGKGPLVKAIVAQYVQDNPTVTYEELLKVFPRNPIMPRFGIFEEIDKAKMIAKKGNRYFMKEEQVISLADCRVIITNQWTKALLDQFLDLIQPLNYDIG